MLSHAVLSWLEEIFRARFGLRTLILTHTEGAISLLLPGTPGAVHFSTAHTQLMVGDGSVSCGAWNASVEGWQSPVAGALPMPGALDVGQPLVEFRGNDAFVGYNVPALCYWMLARVEEVETDVRDSHQRFPSSQSHAYRHGYLERPIVDEWLLIVGEILKRIWPRCPSPVRGPEMHLSHDVDRPSRYGFQPVSGLIRGVGAELLLARDWRKAVLAVQAWIGTRERLYQHDPYNSFDWIMDCAEERGVRSTFHFISQRRHRKFDADYDMEHLAISDLLRRVHQRGHAIALHPGYLTAHDPAALADDAARLRRVCAALGIEQDRWGSRMHYLRWEHPLTLRACDAAGLAYDETLGFSDRVGFRCGTCHEYPAFDPVADQRLSIRIRPLIAMEAAVTYSRNLNLGLGEAACAKFTQLKQTCRRVGGTFSLLWHNSELVTTEQRELYRAVLAA